MMEIIGRQEEDRPLLNDADVVRRAVEIRPSEFEYASPSLRRDKDFILSLAVMNGRTLFYADEALRRDEA